MGKIIRKNEIGINYECSVVANAIYNNETYVIYTDFVNDTYGNLRLFVAKLKNKKLISVDKNIEKKIIEEFKKLEIGALKKLSEVLK